MNKKSQSILLFLIMIVSFAVFFYYFYGCPVLHVGHFDKIIDDYDTQIQNANCGSDPENLDCGRLYSARDKVVNERNKIICLK